MKNGGAAELGALMAGLALSAVETQRALNQGYERDLAAALPGARAVAGVLGAAAGTGLLPAIPAALQTHVRLRVSLRRTRAFGFALMARPVNLGFRISHESAEETESEIRLEIAQTPAPPRLSKGG